LVIKVMNHKYSCIHSLLVYCFAG